MKTRKKYQIPPKEREEWGLLVTGSLEHNFQNFVLQMKSADYKRKQITIDQAIDDMYQLCEKYAIAVQEDFKVIFDNSK